VAAESKSIKLRIDADGRLAAAAGGAGRFLADAAGLEGNAITQLQDAIVAACKGAFEHLTEEHPHLDVTLTRFPDRIEVALAQEGEPFPAIGLDTIVGANLPTNTGGGTAALLGGVDRVQYETRGGLAVTRLTKYITPTAPQI
jgi:hypothetical protein